jgi:hypothetical protein
VLTKEMLDEIGARLASKSLAWLAQQA